MFSALREQGRQALIPFVTAGDPEPCSNAAVDACPGRGRRRHHRTRVPFLRSDGRWTGDSTRQRAALKHHVSLRVRCNRHGARFPPHEQHTPVVLMGYLNPLEVMGYAAFAEAAAAGVDGC